MTHTLQVWADETRVAHIEHEGRDDRWSLRYAEPWVGDARSYPLSPALPLLRPAGGHASASIKRFIEHLLPEGPALDVALAYNGLARTNVFGLIWALGAETAGALRFTGDGSGGAAGWRAHPARNPPPGARPAHRRARARAADRVGRQGPHVSGRPARQAAGLPRPADGRTGRGTAGDSSWWTGSAWRPPTSSSRTPATRRRRTWRSTSTSACHWPAA
jgi:HipA-like protein